MGLEVDNADVEELVEDQRNGLTTEELEHFQEQQKMLEQEMSSETEEGREDVPSSLIYEMCTKWGEVHLWKDITLTKL
jgi:hypothetical protein